MRGKTEVDEMIYYIAVAGYDGDPDEYTAFVSQDRSKCEDAMVKSFGDWVELRSWNVGRQTMETLEYRRTLYRRPLSGLQTCD